MQNGSSLIDRNSPPLKLQIKHVGIIILRSTQKPEASGPWGWIDIWSYTIIIVNNYYYLFDRHTSDTFKIMNNKLLNCHILLRNNNKQLALDAILRLFFGYTLNVNFTEHKQRVLIATLWNVYPMPFFFLKRTPLRHIANFLYSTIFMYCLWLAFEDVQKHLIERDARLGLDKQSIH